MPVNYNLIKTLLYRLHLINSCHKCIWLIPKGTLHRKNVKHAVQTQQVFGKTLPSSSSASHWYERSLFIYWLSFHCRRQPHVLLGWFHLGSSLSDSIWLIQPPLWWTFGWFPFTGPTTTWFIVSTICWVNNKYLLKSTGSFPFTLE